MIVKSAVISECGKHRYRLERAWGAGKGTVLWVMLNPSTADGKTNDATITKIAEMTHRWAYSGLVVVNLFTYRATDPKELSKVGPRDLNGPDATKHLVNELRRKPALVVVGWGANRHAEQRGKVVTKLIRHFGLTPMCFKINKNGSPVHPLYQSYSAKLIPYVQPV